MQCSSEQCRVHVLFSLVMRIIMLIMKRTSAWHAIRSALLLRLVGTHVLHTSRSASHGVVTLAPVPTGFCHKQPWISQAFPMSPPDSVLSSSSAHLNLVPGHITSQDTLQVLGLVEWSKSMQYYSQCLWVVTGAPASHRMHFFQSLHGKVGQWSLRPTSLHIFLDLGSGTHAQSHFEGL